MNTFVVDASVAIKWFIPEVHSVEATRLMDLADELWAPDLLIAEVGNTVWKKCRLGEMSHSEGQLVIRALNQLPLKFCPSGDLVAPAFEIAFALGRTVYDSLYISLACLLSTKVITADRKLFNSLQTTGLAETISWIGDLT